VPNPTFDLFGNEVLPKWQPGKTARPADPAMRPATDTASVTPSPCDDPLLAILNWFRNQPDGATAEQASAALGNDVSVAVAKLAALGRLNHTGALEKRPDGTYARVLAAGKAQP
jgi:hypothetical protein